jgi:Fe(II)/alpha-ketoglutarate-dependent arginine beta-hydroxylase
MRLIELTEQEITQIEAITCDLLTSVDSISVSRVLEVAHLYSHELPRRIRAAFYDVRLTESAPGLWVRGFPIADAAIGPTPIQLPGDEVAERVTREVIPHFLYTALLGEPIAWTTQQGGHVLNDIIPIEEHADQAMSSSSRRLFDLHTEDAFHRYTPDYIGLMCLRNPDSVPTTVSVLDVDLLPLWARKVLLQPRFIVGVNAVHASHGIGQPATHVPLLFGGQEAPYMRVNLNQQAAGAEDEEAEAALDLLVNHLRASATDIVLRPGDCLYLDNFRVAHGRAVYAPRYDGTDRWLKRLTITSYLRKSRDMRVSAGSRTILTAGVS